MDTRRRAARTRFIERLRYFNKWVTNPIMLRFAGRRWFAVVYHTGRRSRRSYKTPVLAAPFRDGFVIPLPYGKHVDWCRNVLAAGCCTLVWRGKLYEAVRPQIIDAADAIDAFSQRVQRLLRRNEVSQFMQLAANNTIGATPVDVEGARSGN